MRIGIGQLWQETNTFNPVVTTRADFEQFGVLRGAAVVERMADTNELEGSSSRYGNGPSSRKSSAWSVCRPGRLGLLIKKPGAGW